MAKTGVVVITGASAGLGRAMVRALAPRGLGLAPLARGRAGLKAAASKARERHGVLPIIPPERNSRLRVRRERSETPMIPRLSEAAGSAADVALTAEERPSEKRLPNHDALEKNQ